MTWLIHTWTRPAWCQTPCSYPPSWEWGGRWGNRARSLTGSACWGSRTRSETLQFNLPWEQILESNRTTMTIGPSCQTCRSIQALKGVCGTLWCCISGKPPSQQAAKQFCSYGSAPLPKSHWNGFKYYLTENSVELTTNLIFRICMIES